MWKMAGLSRSKVARAHVVKSKIKMESLALIMVLRRRDQGIVKFKVVVLYFSGCLSKAFGNGWSHYQPLHSCL